MNRIKTFIVLMIVCTCAKVYAGNPAVVNQLINHKDWNFVENKGQLADQEGNILSDIKYYGHQGGVNLYCRPGIISFVFTKNETDNIQISESSGTIGFPLIKGAGGFDAMKHKPSQSSKLTTQRTDLILLNSNPNAQIIAADKQEYYENFYLAHTPEAGITNVRTYKTITYSEIYRHIDLVLHARENGMKYEFVVRPGGKVSDIQMQWNGMQNIAMTENGGIFYGLKLGEMKESKPVSFQGDDLVGSAFIKHHNRVGFKVDRYDRAKVLVIDPTLVWGTYFGGISSEVGYGISTDPFGNVYISGSTQSISMIATNGTYQTNNQGYDDAFLAKFNGSGKILWSTYYGGNGDEDCRGVTNDKSGNVFIIGYTSSNTGIATSGSFQPFFMGNSSNSNPYFAKFNNSGIRQWATYFGKSTGNGGEGIVTDASGNLFVTGTNESTSSISTTGAYQTSLIGYNNAFLAKFTSAGSLLWGTYFGRKSEEGYSVAIDPSGNVFMSGVTESSSGLATTGAFQTSFSGSYASFLAKFTSTGTRLWSTYYGGNSSGSIDEGRAVVTDGNGNVYLSGATQSTTGIATNGAYQTSLAGVKNAFLAKFDGNGVRLWGTYYGGSNTDYNFDACIDIYGSIYMSGYTGSNSGIATNGAYQTLLSGSTNAFLTKFSSIGKRLWATYFGGQGFTYAFDVATDISGNVYIVGTTSSNSLIATNGSYQTSYEGSNDAFLAKFGDKPSYDAGVNSFASPKGNSCNDTLPVQVQLKNYGRRELDSVNIRLSINGKLKPWYVWKGKLKPDSTISVNLGIYKFPPGHDTIKSWTSEPNGTLDSFPGNDTATTIINIYLLPKANAGPDTILCYNQIYTMQGSGGVTYTWHPATYLSSATDPNAKAVLPNTEHYILVVSNAHGCQDSSPVLLKVRPRLRVKASAVNNPVCYGQIVILLATGSGGDSLHYSFTWPDDHKAGGTITEKAFVSGWHRVILNDNCSPAQAMDSVYVTVIPPPKASFTWLPGSPVHVKSPVNFQNQSSNASSYLWKFGANDSSKLVSPVYIYTDSGKYNVLLVAYGESPCPNDTAYGFIKVISKQITIYVPNAFTPDNDGTNEVFDISGTGIKSYSYNIYNRWGEHIFHGDTGHTGWDGTFKGEAVLESVYIYQLDVIDIEGSHHYLSGNITLMR
jgi:gliding motility-associated-like protein